MINRKRRLSGIDPLDGSYLAHVDGYGKALPVSSGRYKIASKFKD